MIKGVTHTKSDRRIPRERKRERERVRNIYRGSESEIGRHEMCVSVSVREREREGGSTQNKKQEEWETDTKGVIVREVHTKRMKERKLHSQQKEYIYIYIYIYTHRRRYTRKKEILKNVKIESDTKKEIKQSVFLSHSHKTRERDTHSVRKREILTLQNRSA